MNFGRGTPARARAGHPCCWVQDNLCDGTVSAAACCAVQGYRRGFFLFLFLFLFSFSFSFLFCFLFLRFLDLAYVSSMCACVELAGWWFVFFFFGVFVWSGLYSFPFGTTRPEQKDDGYDLKTGDKSTICPATTGSGSKVCFPRTEPRGDGLMGHTPSPLVHVQIPRL